MSNAGREPISALSSYEHRSRVPRRVETVARRFREKDPKRVSMFYDGALPLEKKFPRQYNTYAGIGMRLMDTDMDFAIAFFETAHLCLEKVRPIYRGPVLNAVSKLIDHDTRIAREFFFDASQLTHELNDRADADTLLIQYIHDQRTASIIYKTIDIKTHGREYANKVKGFY